MADRHQGKSLGRNTMTMQENKLGGLANNFWAQMGILAVVAVVVVAIAAKYLW
jgi:hypothetical protein